VLLCPSRDQGAKRSEVATAGSEVSFIEQIAGARIGTFPHSERAVGGWSLSVAFQSGAAWRLDVISRLDKRREPAWSSSR
jgi:hypothetical protein